MIADLIASIPGNLPVLIAGPTASGKSTLALALAEKQGGVIINADASQVYDCWRVLTARPSPAEQARASHRLYGHIPFDAPYSTGHWLREVSSMLDGPRPIIVGGTGLYFSALTEGLADIPSTPAEVRAQADAMPLEDLAFALDVKTVSRIDMANRARVQRAWEVQYATGRPLSDWQDDTPPPLLKRGQFTGVVLDSPKEWLTPRITRRFDQMLHAGGLDEARAMQSRYNPALPACRAIGVTEAMAVVTGQMTHAAAVNSATVVTRQYAKRQRTWFRARLRDWQWVASQSL